MQKIIFHNKKVLKLTNVLQKMIEEDKIETYNFEIEKMQNYLKTKGAMSVGPLIQYTNVFVNESGELDMEIKILLQSNNFIHNVEPPYQMESLIRVKNCMYVSYQGEESKLKFAYDKINLKAFEEDIPLKGDSYTIFIDQQDDQIIADVFMERADNE
jgi:hypothetical protein